MMSGVAKAGDNADVFAILDQNIEQNAVEDQAWNQYEASELPFSEQLIDEMRVQIHDKTVGENPKFARYFAELVVNYINLAGETNS